MCKSLPFSVLGIMRHVFLFYALFTFVSFLHTMAHRNSKAISAVDTVQSRLAIGNPLVDGWAKVRPSYNS